MAELSALPPTTAVPEPEQVKTKTKRAPTEYNKFCAETLKTLSGFPPKERLTECGRLWKLKQAGSDKVVATPATSAPVESKDSASAEKVVVPSEKAKKEPATKKEPSEKAKKEPAVKKEPSEKAKKEQSVTV